MTDADIRRALDVLAGSDETAVELLIHGHGCKADAVIAAIDQGLVGGRVAEKANPEITVVYLSITDAGRVWLERAKLRTR